jgi:hypothetical protein
MGPEGTNSDEAFEKWAMANGYHEDLELDRYPDKNGDYSPTNCRWATREQNMRNTRSNRQLTAFGQTKPMVEWGEEFGINGSALRSRIEGGLPVEQALTKPIKQKKKYSLHELIDEDGKTHSIDYWCEHYGISRDTVSTRLQLGWTVVEAFTRPVRTAVTITIAGETRTIEEWCERYGIKYQTVWKRIKDGWPAEVAVTKPVRTNSRWSK